ncbi:MAG: hypothetical protein PVH63_04150 [Balneolaceae bacterium]|jgi:uncharacterized membrane protein YphA (DoxX/SURF4 family)
MIETQIAKFKKRSFFKYFTVFLRISLGLSFIYPSLPKILGHRFTLLGPDTQIGYFFEALYQTGLYWHFIGAAQFTAGICLLVPRLSTLGAVLFFPIITNIFVITISMPFKGTPFVTGAMLFGGLYLLFWDYDRLKYIVVPPPTR